MVNFPTWLDAELIKRNWTRADLSQFAQISQSTLSLIYRGDRKPGPEVCNAIAQALKLPATEVFRAAGLLPPATDTDPMQERLDHLYTTLKDPANKQRALDFLEFLQLQETKTPYHVEPKTQPR